MKNNTLLVVSVLLIVFPSLFHAYQFDFLGLQSIDRGQKVQAVVASYNNVTEKFKFGVPSHSYSFDSQLQLCINAHFQDHYYAVQVCELDEYMYDYFVLSNNGTVSKLKYMIDDQVANYLTVSWYYSTALDALVSIGWQMPMGCIYDNNVYNIRGRTKTNYVYFDKKNVACENPHMYGQEHQYEPQVAMVYPRSGKVQKLAQVPGFAFLECSSLVIEGGGTQMYNYGFADENMNFFTMSINLDSFQQHVVSFEKSLGLGLNFASNGAWGSSFFVSTESGAVVMVNPLLRTYVKLANLVGDVTLATSFQLPDNAYTVLVNTDQGRQLARIVKPHSASYNLFQVPMYNETVANFYVVET